MRIIAPSAALVALLLTFALPASAATLQAGETYVLSQGEVVADNLYAAGGDVSILGTAAADALLAGGNVIIAGPVGADLSIAGGTITVLESVGGDARVVGGQVTIAGVVGGDLIVAGGMVHVLQGASIGGDVVVAGGRIIIDAPVAGSVRLYGGEVVLNAPVQGAITIRADESVTFGEQAAFSGDVSYTAPAEALVKDGAEVGENIAFTKSMGRASGQVSPDAFLVGFLALLGFFALMTFLAGIVAVLLAVLFFKTFSQDVAAQAISSFPRSAGLGFLALVAIPAAALVLLVSLIGFVPALVLGLLYGLLLIVAHVLSAVIAGAVLALWFKKEPVVNWKWALLGLVSLHIIKVVPVLGWAVCFVFFLAALGVVSEMLYRAVRGE